MDKDKIVLKDGTVIEVNQAGNTDMFQMSITSMEELQTVLDKLTPDNLEQYQIQNQAGAVVANPVNKECLSCSLDLIRNDSGVITEITATFVITDMDMIAKAIRELRESQEVQDGAIIEIAEMVAGGDV